MKIVLTNDDGIDAPGLLALETLAREFADVTVVAPKEEQSSMGHRVTHHAPIEVEELDKEHIRVAGTPADCARLALTNVVRRADWVWSGINLGGNLGVDLYMSGTVGAAREAALLGYPALAISQYIVRGIPLDWDLTIQRARPILRHLLDQAQEPGTFWNINLPHPAHQDADLSWKICPVDPSPLQILYTREGSHYQYAGNYHARPRRPGHDIDVCFAGDISVSRVPVMCSPE